MRNSLAEYTPLRFSPRHAEEHRQPRPAADEDRVEALLGQQLVDGDERAHHGVGHDLDAERRQRLDLGRDDVLGQAELGDAVGEHAARRVQRLEDRDRVAELRELACARQAGRAGADDRAAQSARRRRLGHAAVLELAREVGVAEEALEAPDRDRLALLGEHARRLALLLLRAHAAADRGQRVAVLEDRRRPPDGRRR